jgi:hypothetical protein
MSNITREHLARVLSLGPVTVTFTKADGTQRKMNCTQASHLLPEAYRTHSGELLTEVPVPGDQMRVYDLDINEWRSFRVSSVTGISVVSEDPSPEVFLLEG